MKLRRYAISSPQTVAAAREPEGGGIYLITAEPEGRVIYIGMTGKFKSRRFDRHHKRLAWSRACKPGEEPAIRFAVLFPEFSKTQRRDVEASLIRHAKPDCNEQHKTALHSSIPECDHFHAKHCRDCDER